MGHHVVAYPSGTTLPDVGTLPDGVALMIDGITYVLRDGSWEISGGGGGSGGSDLVGPFEYGTSYDAGNIVEQAGSLWKATQTTVGTDVPGAAITPNAVTGSSTATTSDISAAVKFQVAVPCRLQAVTVSRTYTGTLNGMVGITNADPIAGLSWVAWKDVHEVDSGTMTRTYTLNLDPMGVELAIPGADLVPGTDYWMIFDSCAQGLLRTPTPAVSGVISLPSSTYQYGAGGYGSSRAGSLLFNFSHFDPSSLPMSPAWDLVFQGTPPAYLDETADYPTRVRVMSDGGKLWGLMVSDLGVISTEAVPAPANKTIATSGVWGTVAPTDQWVGETLLSQGSVEVPASSGNFHGAPVWFKWTASNDQEVAFDSSGSEYDTVIAVYKATGTPAAYTDLTPVTSADSGGSDILTGGHSTSRAVFTPVSGTTYYIELYAYALSSTNFGYGKSVLTKTTNATQ